MKDWLTAREIAAEALPDIPATKRGVNDFAEREGWNAHPSFARPRAGRGGGLEYHYRILPTLAQVAYQQRHMRIGIVDLPPAANDESSSPATTDPVSDRAALERDARLAIVKQFEQFRGGLTLGQMSALQVFTDKYNARTLHIADWVLPVVPRLTKPTLLRWLRKKKAGASLAVDRAKARKGTGVLDTANGGAVKAFILMLIAYKPHLAVEEIRRQVRGKFGDTLDLTSKAVATTVDVPPVRTFQHFLKGLKQAHKAELLKLTNPDAFRSTMALSGTGSLAHVTEPNQLWQIDASPVDALCTDGRHSVYACIDIATRRTIYYLSKTPTAEAVGLLIRRAILEWGVPDEIKCDNGSDFVAVATRRLCASLDIALNPSDAYSPEQKGFVERVIKTFQHGPIELVPGYIGHSVADRKAIENRKSFAIRRQEDDAAVFDVSLSGAELQSICDRWAETLYQHRPHGGLKGRTPFQVAAASTHTIRRVDERALDILLAPVAGKDGLRTVTKFGIRIENFHYIHETILPGRQVFVRRDPKDIGCIIVFDPADGRFLGEAVCAELAGIDPKTWLKAKKELRSEYLSERLKDIRAGMRQIASGPALHERALDVAARDLPNVVALPKPETPHSTADIRAAIDAADAATPKPAPPLTGRAAEVHAQLKREAAGLQQEPAPRSNVTQLQTRETRWRRALAIEAAIAASEDVPVEDALWLGGYRDDPEYRVMKQMSAEHGQTMRF